MTTSRLNHGEPQSTDERQQLLLKYLLGDLPIDVAAGIEARLARDAALQDQLNELLQTRTSLLSARANSFGPYFKQRVLRRLQPAFGLDGAQAFYDSLRSMFTRAAVACLLAAAALGTLNILSYGESEVASSVPEALFGLPSATLMDALDYPVL